MKRLLAAALCCLPFLVPEYGHAATPKLAPAWKCTMANRMEAFVDENNLLWECQCQVLAKGFICRWEKIAKVSPVSLRRWQHAHPRVVIHYPLAVTL